MFEITYNDAPKLQKYITDMKAYKGGIYDFTLEDRFLIYHVVLKHRNTYIAIDKRTGQGSQVIDIKEGLVIPEIKYPVLIPDILFSIKYTGDRRYLTVFSDNPELIIDCIFRSILPSYGYTVREEQINLSKSVFFGFQNKKISICEAEVGTGKTLAYLVAAIVAKNCEIRGYRSGYPITITTSSIELQKTLAEKEIPNLSNILYKNGFISHPLETVLRKGKEHYFCYKRFRDFVSQKRFDEKQKADIEKLNEFKRKARLSKTLDLDEYDLRPYVKNKICVKGNCKNCPYSNKCRYYNYIEFAMNNKKIDFQITNHNQFVADMMGRVTEKNTILQPSDFIIIDEAHKFKEAASDIISISIDELSVNEFADNEIRDCKKKINNTVSKYEEIKRLNKLLFDNFRIRIDSEPDDKNVIFDLNGLERSLIGKILKCFDSIKALQENKNTKRDLYLEKYKNLISEGNLLYLDRDENGVVVIKAVSKTLNFQIYKYVWKNRISFALTSGTMSDGTSFRYFKRELGIDAIKSILIHERITKSPFDYEAHTRLYIPDKLPYPDDEYKKNDNTYYDRIASHIVDIVNATNGHTAILFTSYKALKSVYKIAQEKLDKYELICMGQNDKMAISKFKESKNAVFFAAGSMWEGVDVIGDTLSSIIIVRLPFPLRNAVMEMKKDKYNTIEEFVGEVAVPDMIIKLRQGIGRLIRCETDTGLISILDSRVQKSSYSGRVQSVLSRYPRVKSLEEVTEFFYSVKSDEYFTNVEGDLSD